MLIKSIRCSADWQLHFGNAYDNNAAPYEILGGLYIFKSSHRHLSNWHRCTWYCSDHFSGRRLQLYIRQRSKLCGYLVIHFISMLWYSQLWVMSMTEGWYLWSVWFLPEASFGLRVLSLPASVRPSVSPSVTKFVRAITHYPFKLGSPNLDQRCKRPWLRSLLFCGTIDRKLQGQMALQSQNLPHFEFVHAITRYQLKLQFPNLEQNCILALIRSSLIVGLIEIDLQFNFSISNPDHIELFMYIIGIL